MKMRRTAIIAFLLCACMVIGIGYAAITRDLFVLANVNVASSSLDVYFTAAAPDTETTDNLCTEAKVVDQTHVRMTTGTMNAKDQTAVALFTITNQMPDVAASVEYVQSSLSGSLSSDYFTITREFLRVDEVADTDVTFENVGGVNTKVTSLPAGKSVILKITITLNQSIADLTSAAEIEMTGEFIATTPPTNN